MAGTYSQIYIHVVFAVQGRQNLLAKPWRDEVFKYTAGIVKNKGQKPIIINGVEDHVHAFLGLKPSIALSDLVRDINKEQLNKFHQQEQVSEGTIQLAGRVRRILLQPFANWKRVRLHPESGKTPRQTDLQGRVPRFSTQI
jgi:REP element-mobilizing transposase RayT